MDKATTQQSANRIGFAGEQILSHLDELARVPCPKCGECDLSVTLLAGNKNVLIRCSESLQDYNYEEDEVIPLVCDYVQVIKRASLSQPPFNLKFQEEGKRGTRRNSKPSATPRRRRSS